MDSKALIISFVSVAISLIAVAISSVNVYYALFARFDPVVTVGGPVFQFAKATPENPGLSQGVGPEFDPQKERVLGAILLPVVVTHEGGRLGVISDVMLRVSLVGHDDNWLFEPRLFFDERAFLSSSDATSLAKSMEAAFSPIAVAKGDQTKRFIMFQATEHSRYPGGRLRVGQYVVDVLVRNWPNRQLQEVRFHRSGFWP